MFCSNPGTPLLLYIVVCLGITGRNTLPVSHLSRRFGILFSFTGKIRHLNVSDDWIAVPCTRHRVFGWPTQCSWIIVGIHVQLSSCQVPIKEVRSHVPIVQIWELRMTLLVNSGCRSGHLHVIVPPSLPINTMATWWLDRSFYLTCCSSCLVLRKLPLVVWWPLSSE